MAFLAITEKLYVMVGESEIIFLCNAIKFGYGTKIKGKDFSTPYALEMMMVRVGAYKLVKGCAFRIYCFMDQVQLAHDFEISIDRSHIGRRHFFDAFFKKSLCRYQSVRRISKDLKYDLPLMGHPKT